MRANPIYVKYCPHGLDENIFKPLDDNDPKLLEFKKFIFKDKEPKFVLFFNSRNIRRKQIPDTMWSFKIFLDSLSEEKRKDCYLVLHTELIHEAGTDLIACKEYMFANYPDNVLLTQDSLSEEQLNMFYNLADATILLTSNEGWGLSLTESILAGTPIIANVQGGMQDQMRFTDINQDWIEFSEDFPSNHRGKYKNCGKWAFPVYPSNISIQGSPITPYITDDRCRPEDAARQIRNVYDLDRKERKNKGLEGRKWALSSEANFTGKKMAENIIKSIDYLLDNWKPRESFEFINATEFIPDTSRKLNINY
jgi:glycosyltransferase involved in cell wall biosynthesis